MPSTMPGGSAPQHFPSASAPASSDPSAMFMPPGQQQQHAHPYMQPYGGMGHAFLQPPPSSQETSAAQNAMQQRLVRPSK